MSYAKNLKATFEGVALNIEDLFLLESFQISYLPNRIPKPEFAAVLRAYPILHRYFVSMYPTIKTFISEILNDDFPDSNDKAIEENCNDLLWEIADLIIYNKHPEVYDKKVGFYWDINEIISPKSLDGKVVIDAGAGTGKLAFLLSKFADTIFVVEPVRSFREFVKEKAQKENVNNVFVVDGFLDSIPFPDNSIDILMTSNAIGWNLLRELTEIERVLKTNTCAIHLIRTTAPKVENNIHDVLISSAWNYNCTEFQDLSGWRLKYSKKTIL